jgi:serine/threonine protein kinase
MDSSTQYIINTIKMDDNNILKNIMKLRKCEKCQNECFNSKSCEFCIKKYLENRFSKWSSENKEIDELIQNCQKNFLKPDFIVEWIPYNKLEDIQYMTPGRFNKVKALWTEGKFVNWDYERQELKRFGPHFIAVKYINMNKEQWLQEIKAYLLLSSTISPVIRSYGLSKDYGNNNYMVITEILPYNLKNYLQDNLSSLNWVQKCKILLDIAESLGSIHNNKLIHGDLHSETIGYSTNREIWLIGDFRFCRPIDNPLNRSFGTMPYVAPEMLKREKMTTSSDIYSFAMIMWELSTSAQPFEDNRSELSTDIINGLRPNIMKGTPKHYSRLMEKCWDGDPLKRPDILTIQNEIKNILNNYYNNNMSQKEQVEMSSINYLKKKEIK